MSAESQDQKKPLPDTHALFQNLSSKRIAELIREARVEAARETNPIRLQLFSEVLDASGQVKPNHLWLAYQARLESDKFIKAETEAQLMREGVLLAVLMEKYEKVNDLEGKYTDILVSQNRLPDFIIKDAKALFMAWTAVGVICSLWLVLKGAAALILGAGFVGIANSGLFLLIIGVAIPFALFLAWKLASGLFTGPNNTKSQVSRLLELTAQNQRLWQERLQESISSFESRQSGDLVISENNALAIWGELCRDYEWLEKKEINLASKYQRELKRYKEDQLAPLVVMHVISSTLVLGLGSFFLFKGSSALIAGGISMLPFSVIALGLLIICVAIAEARYIYYRVNPKRDSQVQVSNSALKIASGAEQVSAASLQAHSPAYSAPPSPRSTPLASPIKKQATGK